MDYETKIYLDKLIEAIDSPDWWMIVLTVINIVAFGFVAVTQIRLQKQQTKLQELQIKQQEYELYRRLYKLFLAIHNTADGLIFKIYSNIEMGDLVSHSWKETLNDVQQLQDDLKDATVDIRLKLPEDSVRISQYSFLISTMIGLINRIIVFDKNNQIIKPKITSITDILNDMKQDDNYLIPIILSRIQENDLKDYFKTALIGISTMKDFCEDAFLDKIKAKI